MTAKKKDNDINLLSCESFISLLQVKIQFSMTKDTSIVAKNSFAKCITIESLR